MSSTLSPPGTTEEVRAASTLVLAPHYDDEVLGCGGLLVRLTSAGAAVRVLFLSDGGGSDGGGSDGGGSDGGGSDGGGSHDAEKRTACSRRRRQEAKDAAKVFGIAGIDHLDLPDGDLDQHLEAMAEGIRRALLSQRPSLLLVPSPLEASSDHRAAFRALHDLLGSLRRGDTLWPLVRDLDVLAYEINHPLRPDVLVDIGEQIEAIERAMACYGSQQELHDYLAACLGLARFRALTLTPEVRAAEAFRRLALDDFRTRGPAALISELAGISPCGGTAEGLEIVAGPKISVIVRTRDRPELLREALASLAANTYRPAEIVLVNDGGAPPSVPADFPRRVKIVELESNRGRAAAANAGIAAAGGEYVTFLDDDDLAEPEHLATLAGLVRAAGVRIAYTDAAVGVYELDGGVAPEGGKRNLGWRCTERRIPYSRDFDPELLLFDNYIPFNTLLVERRLIEQAGELDDQLPFFEDWDYLIRLAALAPFHHLARVTCEYRHFRGGGHHILGDEPRRRSDFLAMKARVIAKHAKRGGPDAIARAVDRLRAECVTENEDVDRLRGEAAAVRADLALGEERYHRLNGKLAGLEVHQQVLEESERRAREQLRRREGEIHGLSHQIQQLHDHAGQQTESLRRQDEALRRTYDEIERLNELIRTMESSKAWRAHQWWQEHRPGRDS